MPPHEMIAAEERMAIAVRVCGNVAQGALLRDEIAMAGLSAREWWRWCEEYETIGRQFARARIAQAHALAEQALAMADAVKGEPSENVQAVRLSVDTRKWFASKMAPKIYGDSLDLSSAGLRIGVIALPPELPAQDAPSPALQRGDGPSV